MKMKSKKLLLVLAVAVGFAGHIALLPQPAWCEYPDRPVTVMVAMAAGGATDIALRALAPSVGEVLGQPIAVENKPGGGGTVAASIVATAQKDGYTLFAGQNVSIIDTALMQSVQFIPLKSFTPIMALAASEHSALLVKSDAPWKNFKEFIEYAKNNPGKIKYSSAGVGSGMHVAMEYIAHKDGIKWVHVPYQGTAPARTALMGGHVDACSSGVDWPPFVKSGQLRVLATHGRERMSQYPDVPTFKELGSGFVSETVHMILGPADLAPETARKLEKAFIKGAGTPEFKKACETLYLTPYVIGSAELDSHLKEKWKNTEKLFKEIGLIKESATQPY